MYHEPFPASLDHPYSFLGSSTLHSIGRVTYGLCAKLDLTPVARALHSPAFQCSRLVIPWQIHQNRGDVYSFTYTAHAVRNVGGDKGLRAGRGLSSKPSSPAPHTPLAFPENGTSDAKPSKALLIISLGA
ncbi:unnamed protein product [Natator depressus]